MHGEFQFLKRGGQINTPLHDMMLPCCSRCSYGMQACFIYHIKVIYQIFYESICFNEGVIK